MSRKRSRRIESAIMALWLVAAVAVAGYGVVLLADGDESAKLRKELLSRPTRTVTAVSGDNLTKVVRRSGLLSDRAYTPVAIEVVRELNPQHKRNSALVPGESITVPVSSPSGQDRTR